MEHYLVYIAFALLLYCMYSARIGSFGITMPMVCLALGVLFGLVDSTLGLGAATTFHHLAEVTLALLLFADATSLRRDSLRKIGQRTQRMLLVGLPLAIVIGACVNWLLLPDWPLWEICLLAALLAPTDAALGQSIQSNDKIPQDYRDAMNAESGLNDGLALPFVVFFAGLAVGDSDPSSGGSVLVTLVAREICIGAAVGLAGGFVIGKLRNHVNERGLMDPELGQVAVLILVGFVYFAADHIGGNAFVAVFVAGLAYANTVKASILPARHFLEGDGQFLAMLSFFFIGVLFIPEALGYMTGPGLLVILLSLLVVRPLAIWLSLMGTRTSANERLFYGWFGPRGLATALFAIFVATDFKGIVMVQQIVAIAITAVLISAFAHGFTAKYAAQMFRLDKSGEN